MNRRIVFLFVLCVVLAAGVFGQDLTELYRKGHEYFDNGDYNNAIKEYSDVITRYKYVDAYWYRGVSYSVLKNYDAAIADYNIVIQNAPDFADVYIGRGYTYGSKGMYRYAIRDYRQGLEKGYDISTFTVDKSNKADMWLCGTIYMDIVVNKFLGNSTAVTKNEAWLKTVSDNNGITRTEVENYFRAGIRGLVSEIVNEEFNKISFLLDNVPANRTYNTALTRNPQNGHYVLSYERPEIQNSRKTISGQTLETLLSALSKNRDSTQADIAAVRDQAYLIPSAVYASWQSVGVARGADAMKILVDTLTSFYINPNRTNYEAVRGIYARYEALTTLGDPLAKAAENSYMATMKSLSDSLYRRVITDVNSRTVIQMAKIPDDPRFSVFATRYRIGGER